MLTPEAQPLENAVTLPRLRIRANPDQPRKEFAPGQMDELRQSLREYGMLQPLLVRYEPSKFDNVPYILVAGERRWRASEDTLEYVPAIIQNVDEATARELALVENIHRVPLTELEEARAVGDLMTREDLSQRRVAKRLGLSVGWVHSRLSLLKTKPDVLAVAAKTPNAMGSLLLADKVRDSPELRAELLAQIEKGAPQSRIKARVEAHQSAGSIKSQLAKKTSSAPDAETGSRSARADKGEISSVSRGKPMSGTTQFEARQQTERYLREAAQWMPYLSEKDQKGLLKTWIDGVKREYGL